MDRTGMPVSGWRPAAGGALVLGGAGLACSVSLPWTGAGLASTQSLAQLSNLAGTGIVDETWAEPLLLVPAVTGAVTAVAGCLTLASIWGVADGRWLAAAAGVALVAQIAAAVVIAGITVALEGRPVSSPGAGAILAGLSVLVAAPAACVLVAANRLLLRNGVAP